MREFAVKCLFLCVVLLGGCTYVSRWPDGEPSLRLHFLDVGQGLAVLLEYRGEDCSEGCGRFALFDTGPDSVGVLDSLKARGVDSLEWVVVSHFHRDHGGGFMEWGGRPGQPRVKRLLVGLDSDGAYIRDSVLAVASQNKVPVDTIFRGDTLWFGDGVKVEVLWPTNFIHVEGNGASVVLKVAWDKNVDGLGKKEFDGALLTADLDTTGERRLLELSPSLKTSLLQVGHHGSAGSSSLHFLSRIEPQSAVVSVGKKNGYGHPTQSVLNKLKIVLQDSSKIFRTDLQGSLTVEIPRL